jgi:hypothetical protein
MSGDSPQKISEVLTMCNNNGFCGGNICWIILIILLLCNCGGGNGLFNNGGNNCGCGCDNNCGCC